MATQNSNPFVLPGFGQSGDAAQNPLMASMEMMRQAWQGLAGSGAFEHSSMAAPMTLEDLDRRITDLRAVENWLRMNLSMLSSTIQGLEVQRATIATLKAFMATTDSGASPNSASPLDIVLGIKPGKADSDRSGAAAGQPDVDAAAALNNAAAATQGWWDMLQKQFDTIATATAATLHSTEAMKAPVAAKPTDDSAASHSTLDKAPAAAKTAKPVARKAATPSTAAATKAKKATKPAAKTGTATAVSAKKTSKTTPRKASAAGSSTGKKT